MNKKKRAAITVICMSIFAIMGVILRIFIAQLFGEECKNPGTVGWLKASQPLCVTASGEASLEGGIIFADLPSNLLGSFIMGLMQTTDVLGYPKKYPIPWLKKDHKFQSWDIWHLAIRTGFCGSLTTYSAWNSEMVILLFGTGATDQQSRVFRAFLGYLIGVETAIASFILGKNIASALFGYYNPDMKIEKDAIKAQEQRGVWVDTELPDFERRFLAELKMYEYEEHMDATVLQPLLEWRESTRENRRYGDEWLPLLTDVEHTTLILNNDLDGDTRRAAVEVGWNVKALDIWVNEMNVRRIGEPKPDSTPPASIPLLFVFVMLYTVLFTGVIFIDPYDAYSTTWRTMWYAALFAPIGALLRWKWSSYNGKLPGSLGWFPAGTFLANMVGSIVSMVMIGLELRFETVGDLSGFWLSGTLRAIKIGFSGCLTTVSTFISEYSTFLSGDFPFYGHMYVIISLGSSFLLSTIAYALCIIGIEVTDLNEN